LSRQRQRQRDDRQAEHPQQRGGEGEALVLDRGVGQSRPHRDEHGADGAGQPERCLARVLGPKALCEGPLRRFHGEQHHPAAEPDRGDDVGAEGTARRGGGIHEQSDGDDQGGQGGRHHHPDLPPLPVNGG
jgi:hypothetical protein